MVPPGEVRGGEENPEMTDQVSQKYFQRMRLAQKYFLNAPVPAGKNSGAIEYGPGNFFVARSDLMTGSIGFFF